MLLTSIKTLGESTLVPPIIFPAVPQWHNVQDVLATLPFINFYENTILMTPGRTLVVNDLVDQMTLSVGLAALQGEHATNIPVVMAGAVLASWPMLVMFVFFQKHFIEEM